MATGDGFAMLGVIGDRFDLVTAAAVLADTDPGRHETVHLLDSLHAAGLVVAELAVERTLYSVRGAPPLPAVAREQALLRLGQHYLDRYEPASGDARWVAAVAPVLPSIVAAVDDLILLHHQLAARLAMIVARYHRTRHSVALVVGQLADWAGRLPVSSEARVLAGELTFQLMLTGQEQAWPGWIERHEAMTAELGFPCPVYPTEMLRSAAGIASGRFEETERICRRVLASNPNRRVQMLAWWDLGVITINLGRLDEGWAATREAFAAAADLDEAAATADLGYNLVYLACLRDGRLFHAHNILRWMDRPWWDSMQPSAPRLADMASWIAADVGRHLDAARLALLLDAAPPLGVVFTPGAAPTDLLAWIGRDAPAAVREARALPRLTPTEALSVARDVLTDPRLPPQAPPIDEFLTRDLASGEPFPSTTVAGPLAALPPTGQRHLMSNGATRRWRAGSVLTTDQSRVHVVLSGWVGSQSVTPDGNIAILDVAGRGEIIGTLAGTPDPGTAVALGPVETFTVPASVVAGLQARHPAFQDALLAAVAERFTRIQAILLDSMFAPADLRVLRRLVDLCDRLPVADSHELRLSQDELASMAGSTRPTVNRVLRRAERDGLVSLANRRLTVLDLSGLRTRAAGR